MSSTLRRIWGFYLFDHKLDEISQTRVNEISNDSHALLLARIKSSLYVTGHILLQHSLDIPSSPLVVLEDSLTSEKSSLFGRIPVELDGVLALALDDILGCEEYSECLQDSHSSRSIIIGSRRREDAWEEQIDAVLMRTHHHGGIVLAGNGGDDAVLAPWVDEVFGRHAVFLCSGVDDKTLHSLQEPFGRLPAVIGLVVSGVEGGELLEVFLHVRLGEVGEERLQLFLQSDLGWEFRGLPLRGCDGQAEVLMLGDVHEVLAILSEDQG